MGTVAIRELKHHELELIWTIDRSEYVSNIYRYVDGELVLTPAAFDIKDWPPGIRAHKDHSLDFHQCFARGGTFFAAFEGHQLVGISVLDTLLRGRDSDQLQLTFLHVSSSFRSQGIGRALFERASRKAHERGAKFLYVSATPTENSVEFYQRRGCVLAPSPDPELFKLEPEDIHFVCQV